MTFGGIREHVLYLCVFRIKKNLPLYEDLCTPEWIATDTSDDVAERVKDSIWANIPGEGSAP